LQAKLEDTNYRLAQLSQQIAATNQQLKSFSTPPPVENPAGTVPGGPVAPPPSAGGPVGGAGAVGSADPKALYDAAYNDYLKGNYDLSAREFQEYLNNFPTTDLADNATYWIGECYYRQKQYRRAVDQFDQVLQRYP